MGTYKGTTVAMRHGHHQWLNKREQITPQRLDELLGNQDPLKQAEAARAAERVAAAEAIRARHEAERLKHTTTRTSTMTVSLYRSTASGAEEIVVQTNAQTLEVFIIGLADALSRALPHAKLTEGDSEVLKASLRNAFPVAFAIAGYKAERVTEAKLLTCGAAMPDASELVAQSRV